MLSVYSTEQSAQWDAIVRSFRNHDVYWLSGYVKAFQIHGDGVPLLFCYESNNLRGINVVMKRDIALSPKLKDKLPLNTYFDFSTPYGYGGWLLEGELTQKQELFSEYEQFCVSNGIISEFVRFHPVLENAGSAEEFYDITPLGNTVCLDISTEEIIWANISSKNRNIIRKAEKLGVEIFQSSSAEIYDRFIEIYNRTMDRDNAEKYYYFSKDFYDSIRLDLADNSQIFYAVQDGKIIAASIIFNDNNRLNYHLSGSLFEYRSFAPTNLLLYKAALWGCANGCKTFHLGGGVGSGEDGLFKFKKSFYRGDALPRFCIGKKIFIHEQYNLLVNMLPPTDSQFFPKYRA